MYLKTNIVIYSTQVLILLVCEFSSSVYYINPYSAAP